MNFNEKLIALHKSKGLTLDQLVKDVDVEEVRERNLSSEQLNSICTDVNTAKKFINWYLIIGGGAAALAVGYFMLRAALGW